VHQRRQDVLKHHAIRHAAPVAAQRVGWDDERTLRQQGGELVPQRPRDAYWQYRHGCSCDGELVGTATVAEIRACALLAPTPPIAGRSKLMI
jgi:hypothetical protein